jgi:hypothetical protein
MRPSILSILLFLSCAVLTAQAQVQSITANPQPGGNPCTGDVLTKNIGYFTSTTVPSIVVGRGESTCTATGGMFLNYSTGNINGPWQQSTIESTGDHYERAVAFTNNNESYPGIVTSEGQADLTRYLFNPLNSGGNVLGPWSSTTIAQQSCHDMHTADIDRDGKLDIICSADPTNGEEGGYVAYQNSPTSWDEVPYTTPLTSDGIGIININGIWDIAVSNTGATYLYWNP